MTIRNDRLSRQEIDADLADIIGPPESPLDLQLEHTMFLDLAAKTAPRHVSSIRQIASGVKCIRAAAKSELPLLKLGTFGTIPTPKGSLRHNANMLEVTGIEGDYDGEVITPVEGAERLRQAGVAGVIYTSPSHRPEAPRWRVLVPLSAPLPADNRDALCAQLNGVLGGILGKESFTRSQSFYFGHVVGVTFESHLVDGWALDMVRGLPEIGGSSPTTETDTSAPPATSDQAGPSDTAEDDDDRALFAAMARADFDRDRDLIEAALAAIPPGTHHRYHEGWLDIGMALHAGSAGGADGLEMWRRWSSGTAFYQADKAKADRELEEKWKSFGKRQKGRNLGIGTIFHMAKAHGWKKPEPKIEGFPATEDGIARLFAARHGDELRYCHSAKSWFRCTDSHWQRESTGLAHDFARTIAREFSARPDVSESLGRTLERKSTANGVEGHARSDRAFAVTADAWDRDPWILGTPGGTVDLRTGHLHPAQPSDMLTKITAAKPVSLDSFDPARDCPRWVGFLDDTAGGDAELIRFLQQWSGYCLTGDTSLEELLFVHGPAGSGKSTFVAALAGVMGDYALNTPSETLMQRKHAAHREELARLHGARLVWSSEIEDGQRWNEKRIAELTGDDTGTARFMHSNSFDFRPQFKLVIAGNSRPDLRDVGGAMRRRFNVMPFDRQPRVRDTSLKPYLLAGAEFPGILAWAIQGCLDWQQNGLIKPRKLLDATEEYLSAQDTFGQWIAERCETGPHLADTTDNLRESWEAYAPFGTPLGKNPFADRMQGRGFESIQNTCGIRGRGYRGIRVCTSTSVADLL